MNTVDRNVVITFNRSLTNRFIQISKIINQTISSKIVLNITDQIPHLTLYMTKYPEKNIEKVLEKIDELAKKTKVFEMEFNSKSCHSSGTVFIDPVMSKDLYSLHSSLVNILNPLREGLYNEDELNLPGRGEKAKNSLMNFGMWAVKKDYIPHVSVGRIENPQKEAKIALSAIPEEINFKTLVNEISFVERGPNGTCKKILKTFPLKG